MTPPGRSATSGGCGRSWPPAGCSPPPTSRRCSPNAASLSASQIHRLVTGTPERLSLPVLAALANLRGHSRRTHPDPADNTTTRKTAPGDGDGERRRPERAAPRRARLRPQP